MKKSSINPGIKKIFKSEKSDRDKADSSLNIVQMDKSLATPTDFGIKDSDPIFPAEREIAKKIYNALLDARKKVRMFITNYPLIIILILLIVKCRMVMKNLIIRYQQ